MQKRNTFDGGAALAADVADVLRERQGEWLKGWRWPVEVKAIPGAPKLTRTTEHAQANPEDDGGG